MSDVKITLSANGQGLKDGLAQAKGHVDKFKHESEGAFASLGERIVEIFAVEKILEFGKKLFEFGSGIKNTAMALDMSTDSVQGIGGALEHAGASSEQFKNAVIKLNQSLQEARDGSPQVIKDFERLGVTWADIRDKSPEQILYLIADGMHSATDKTQALAAAMGVLGKGGKAMAAGLSEGGEELKHHADEVAKATEKKIARVKELEVAYNSLIHTLSIYAMKAVVDVTNIPENAAKVVENRGTIWSGLKSGAKQIGSAFMAGPSALYDKLLGGVTQEQSDKLRGFDPAKYIADTKAARGESGDGLRYHKGDKFTDSLGEGTYGHDDDLGHTGNTTQSPKTQKEIAEGAKEVMETMRKQQEIGDAIADGEKDRAEKLKDRLDKEKKLTDEKKLQLQTEIQTTLEKQKQQADADLDKNHSKRVSDILKTPDQRREDRRKQGKEDRAESRAKREEHHQGLSTRPGAAKELENFDKLKSSSDKMTEALKESTKALNSLKDKLSIA